MIEIQHWPAVARACPEPLVLLHGWGCDSRSWQPLRERLNQHCDLLVVSLPGFAESSVCEDMDDWLQRLSALLPERFVLLGWSLGGMLATRLAAEYPQRVLGLITLGSNLRFVATDDWPQAMSAAVFEEFYSGFCSAPELTLKRFAGLMARGCAAERSLLKSLRQLSAEALPADTTGWQSGLQWLAALDNRAAFAGLRQAGLHLLADGDALVPAAVADDVQRLNPHQRVELLGAACHALHWSHSAAVAERISTFVEQLHYRVDKQRVAQSFGRAAGSYDSVAGLQRQVGHNLLQQFACESHEVFTADAGRHSATEGDDHSVTDADGRWLDLGCGTGYFEPYLSRQLGVRPAQIIGLDLAEGMLRYARAQRSGDYLWLCADGEALPLADSSVSGVFSTLAIQWCGNLPGLLSELRRVLAPGGRIHLATLGPRTLFELREAWRQVDQFTHVNRFVPEAQLRDVLSSAGLQLERWRSEDIVLRYSQLRELTHELKALGAHNMNQGQAAGLTGRQRIQAFREAYEGFRDDDGLLPATYEVFYLQLSAA